MNNFLKMQIFLQKRQEIFVILLKKSGGIEAVRAFLLALTAVETALNLLHFSFVFVAEVDTQRRAAQIETHSGAVGDVDAGRTWQAIAAATAEVARQFFLVFVDLRPAFSGHRWWIVLI